MDSRLNRHNLTNLIQNSQISKKSTIDNSLYDKLSIGGKKLKMAKTEVA